MKVAYKYLLSLASVVTLAAPALAQNQVQLLPAGNTNLPAGSYLIHNLGTGESIYMQVNGSGQMLVQDSKKLNWSPINLLTGSAGTSGAAGAAGLLGPNLTGGNGNSLLNKLENAVIKQKLNSELNSVTGGTGLNGLAPGSSLSNELKSLTGSGNNLQTGGGTDTQGLKTKIENEIKRQTKKLQQKL